MSVGSEDAVADPAEVDPVEDVYPLSPTQQGILFHSRLAPESAVYFVQTVVTLAGDLDVRRLEGAWQRLVDEHAVLRTAFVWEEEAEPLQVVVRGVRLNVEERDLRSVPAGERERRVEAFLEEDRRRRFDLAQAPLIRVTVLRTADRRHELVFSCHHVVLDGWSLPRVFEDVFALYEGLGAGRAPRLERRRPYRDYIGWLRAQDMAKAERFWRAALAGLEGPTALVLGRDTAPGAPRGYARSSLALSRESTAALQRFAREHGLTPSAVVAGAWALLLARTSASSDVVVGVTVSGRPTDLAGADAMVGLFISTLPLRARTGPEDRVVPWLRKVQESQAAIAELSYAPLVDVQRWSGLPHGRALFDSIVVFENYPLEASAGTTRAGLGIEAVRGFEETSYPLTIVAMPGPELRLHASYETPRFDADVAARMLEQLRVVLEGFVAHPDERVLDLSILPEAERQKLAAWNATERPYRRGVLLHELVAEQVARTPEATAVRFEGERLTYRELDARANQLARRLVGLGVGRGSLVGISVERSLEMVVGLLGILKAGAAYVPIDPEYPRDRLAFMLEDASPPVLLTQARIVPRLPAPRAKVLLLDDPALFGGESREGPRVALGEADLAYGIYTSGSTGKPKCALNTHEGIVNRLIWMQEEYRLEPADRVLQKTPFSFDVSVWEFFWPLLTGATLVMARPEGHRDTAYLVQTIEREAITTLHFVPSMLQVFLEDPGVGRCRSLRRVICSGEALPHDLQEKFFARIPPPAELHNLYGPTEAAVDVSYWACRRGSPERTVPIGRPVANTRLYVLDPNRHPVPIGVPGELWLGGIQLARGYHNRAELTAERFVERPIAGEPRLYRTGDLAKFRPDGAVEYLGRIDHQVKIRGFRIELGEVEAVLAEHPDVRETVVVAREDVPGDKRLAAYFVAKGDLVPTSDALREHLRARLPDYMVPSAFVALPALPLSPNGKVDRKVLPRPDAGAGRTKAFVAPRTEAERALAAIWAEVLRVERVGAEDDFFALGGHSLLATQVVSRLRTALGVEVALRELFESPTLELFAKAVETARAAAGPPLERIPREGELPLSFAQSRLWFLDQLQPGDPTYDMVGAFRIRGRLHHAELERALGEVVRRHEALRTTFGSSNGRPFQRIAPPVAFELPVADLAGEPASEREAIAERLVQEEARRPFDLAKGPLFRARAIRLAPDHHVLVVNMHHVVSDGWSLGILVHEVGTLYDACVAGTKPKLPELPIQYADFAAWQRRWFDGEVLERQVRYWKEKLAGAPALLELPTDRPRPPVQTTRGARIRATLPAALVSRLEATAKAAGGTLFMGLLAGLQALLHRHSGQEKVVVGSPIANRTRTEVEGLIGFFANTLALATDLSGDPSFRELLGRVRETALGAYAHQDLPFEKLVSELETERDTSRSPIFQVMFVLQQPDARPFGLAGATVERLPLDPGTTRFDLHLSAEQAAGEVTFHWDYNTDLFDRATAETLVAQYRALLEAAVASPELALSGLSLEPASPERAGGPLAGERRLHELFREQAKRSPDAVAVTFEGRPLSYRELDERANELARALRERGVERGARVAVCLERSLDAVVAALAVLEAGGAVLPLDPDDPEGWIARVLEVAAPKLVLTRRAIASVLPATAARVLSLDALVSLGADVSRDAHEGKISSANDPETPGNADDPAWLLPTPSRTSKPSLVACSHRSIANALLWTRATADLGAADRVLHGAAPASELAPWELLAPLASGATLVLAPPERPRARGVGRGALQTIAIASTFTAEPVAGPLGFWLDELAIPARVELAAFDQVFQELLDPGSLLARNRSGANVVLVRLEDWMGEDGSFARLDGAVSDLVRAAEGASRRGSVPHLVFVCPPSRRLLSDRKRAEQVGALEQRIVAELGAVAGLHVVPSAELLALYPVPEYDDPYGAKVGRVPYTPAFFAALGTLIARKVRAATTPARKVLVLDCDETLWRGVLGEDGPRGIRIDASRESLQRAVVRHHERGVLVALASKNAEKDVLEAFELRPDMPLRREHLVAWRVNWSSKAENLRSLARELDLGLDSFVFVDDSQIECAAVRAQCPEVLVVELPAEDEKVARLLDHVWELDRARTTAEDRKRTALYRQNALRERLREESLDFATFIQGLGLEVEIAPLAPEQLARVSQLTQRTNQFNATTIRRSESEIQALTASGALEALTVSVRDRFGDYGLVGTVFVRTEPARLAVDTLLLSCRVLGRGVEHRVVARLGEIARERMLAEVAIPFVRTEKNEPALRFLSGLGAATDGNRDRPLFRLDAEAAARLAYTPSAGDEHAADDADAKPASSPAPSPAPARSPGAPALGPRLALVPEIERAIDEAERTRRDPERAAARMARRLARVVAREGVTVLHASSLVLDRLLEPGCLGAAHGLRHVFTSGEPIAPAVAKRVSERLGNTAWRDLLALAEAAPFAAATLRPSGSEAGRVVVGAPIPGAGMHVLDARLAPAPTNVPGELCLSGVMLALEAVGETGRFATDPRSGARLLRTGARARRRPDGTVEVGTVEVLGRLDRELRLHGQRIDPGAIESLLAEHEAVAEAALVPRDPAGRKGLAAFVVARRTAPAPEELRAHLARFLRDEAIPTSFSVVAALPRTATGAVDLAALAKASPAPSDETFVAPRTELERVLAKIWAEVLRVERVGIHDHFFFEGGDSLLLTQLASRISAELQVEVPLQGYFQDPTIAGVARLLLRDPGAMWEEDEENLDNPEQRALEAEVLALCVRARDGRLAGGPDLLAARAGHATKRVSCQRITSRALLDPPAGVDLVRYRSPAGDLAAYLTRDPGDGRRHPALLWAHGGVLGLGRNEVQQLTDWTERDVVVLCPSWRGENDNPGDFEMFYGEVQDLLAALDHLARLPYVDPGRIYLAGHSTGGTLALLAACATDRFRAAFSIGGWFDHPAERAGEEPWPYLPFDRRSADEVRLRSPMPFLHAIRRPTYHLEARSSRRVVASAARAQRLARALGVPLETHTTERGGHNSIVVPLVALLGKKIASDVGPACRIAFTPEELALACAHLSS